MKRRQKQEVSSRRRQLLELWMGGPAPESSSGPRHVSPWVIAGSLVGVILTVGLARYAIDVLFMALGLVTLGLVFHVLGNWLAESDILSPGWFTIISLGVLLGAWAFLVPAEGLVGLGRYVPKPVAEAFERMESRGWARRAFTGPGDGGPGPVGGVSTVDPGTTTAASESNAPSSSRASTPALVLSASRATSTFGEPVMLTARLSDSEQVPVAGSVRFLDERRVLGSAELRREGRATITYITVANLTVGEHELRAELVGPIGLPGGRSDPLVHTVLPRRQ